MDVTRAALVLGLVALAVIGLWAFDYLYCAAG